MINQHNRCNRHKGKIWTSLLLAFAVLAVFSVSLPLCHSIAYATGNVQNPDTNVFDTETSDATDETGLMGMLDSLFSDRSSTIDIVLLMTLISILPSILVMFTSFTRIIIVLSFVRQAMGTQQAPPNQVLVGLALFLTFFIMQPIIVEIQHNAYEPYIAMEIDRDEALKRAMDPLRTFMYEQTNTEDLAVFMSYTENPVVETLDDVPIHALLPAFLTSEIKRALTMGFFVYIPFIVLDMVVASTLMSMGMMMLPPAMISLPFKLLLFVSVDGWMLTVKTLITSFHP